MKLIKLLLISIAMGAAAPAMAQWQWIDKDGRKVFSDRPPGLEVPEKNIVKRPKGYGALNGVQTSGTGPAMRDVAPPTEVGEAAATPADGATPAAKSTDKVKAGKDKELEAKKAAEEKAKADAEKAAKEKQIAAKADNCKRAQQSKAMFDTGKAVRMPNEKGEMVFIDADRRAAEQKRVEEAIFTNC
ncbi:MAG: DUF4124 domain-containing protein [Comamonas sp.]